jgi:hypothetical protein
MKKSLLLAALLLSSAAQAETYFCDGKGGAVLALDKASESLVDADFLINVEEGFKKTGPNQNYQGECQMESVGDGDNMVNSVTCTYITPFAADLIMMDFEALLFTRSLSFAGSLYAWTGQCSAI